MEPKAYIAPNGKMYQDISHGEWSCSMEVFGIYPIYDTSNTLNNMDYLTEQ